MRKVVLAILVVALVAVSALAATAQATSSGTPPLPPCAAGKAHPAYLTVPRLHMRKQLIGASDNDSSLAKGPAWDGDFSQRPGHEQPWQNRIVVVKGHDVTPVPGYHGHGPFHDLPLMRRGDLATLTRCGVRYTYTFERKFTHMQCGTWAASINPLRYTGQASCFVNDSPITRKQWRIENLFFRCCWPRKTDYKFFYVRMVLVSAKPVT